MTRVFPIYCNVNRQSRAQRSGAFGNIGKQMSFPCLVGGNNSLHVGGRSAQIYMEIGPKAVLGKMVTLEDLDESAHPEVELVSVFAEE